MYAVLVHHLGSYHDATKEAAGVLHPKRTTFEQNNGKRPHEMGALKERAEYG